MISGHFTSYRDIKTAKDKAEYYYGFTSGKIAAGLRVLYAPAEGSTATYKQGVLSGDWSFEIVYTDGTSEIVNKTF